MQKGGTIVDLSMLGGFSPVDAKRWLSLVAINVHVNEGDILFMPFGYVMRIVMFV